LFELVANSKNQLVCSVYISRSGIFVETNAPLQLGARVTLIAQSLHRDKPREIRCIVRWTKPNSGAGLEFEELKTSDALWLNQIIGDI
jgi:Tfp pilus assembly protein PilZ